jgi:hypothetical protein
MVVARPRSVNVRIIVVVPALAASLVADVAVESPGSALIREQRVDDFIDGGERSERVGELAMDLAIDDADANRLPIEFQVDAIPRFADLDIHPAGPVAAGHHPFWRLALLTCHLSLRLLARPANSFYTGGWSRKYTLGLPLGRLSVA